jgi:hypothetical protein
MMKFSVSAMVLLSGVDSFMGLLLVFVHREARGER